MNTDLAGLAAVREPQCPGNSWGAVTAAALNDVYNFLKAHSQQAEAMPRPSQSVPPISKDAHGAIKSVKLDSVVMVAHSLGAKVGCLLLSGAFSLDQITKPPVCVSVPVPWRQLVAVSTHAGKQQRHIHRMHACAQQKACMCKSGSMHVHIWKHTFAHLEAYA